MELSKEMLLAYMRRYRISVYAMSRILGVGVDDLNKMLDDDRIVLAEENARRFVYTVGITATLEIMLNKNPEVMRFEKEYRAANLANAY